MRFQQKLLQTVVKALVSPFTLVAKKSFKEGVFPKKLKYSQNFPMKNDTLNLWFNCIGGVSQRSKLFFVYFDLNNQIKQ